MEFLVQDAKVALRRMRSRPAFTIVAVLTLALGIGATTAIFSALRAVLLEPLPYGDADRLVVLWNRWRGTERTWLSEPEVMDYRAGVASLASIAAYSTSSVNLAGDGEPERVSSAALTPEIFDVLDIETLHGRGFRPEEGRPGGENVAVLAYSLWQRRYGGERSAIGATMTISGRPFTVVGVLPPSVRLPLDFEVAAPAEVWTPLVLNPDSLGSRGSHYLLGLARLAPGATVERANAQLQQITQRWAQDGVVHPDAQFGAFTVPVTEAVLGDVRPALLILAGAVLFVLLIACANVANLLLAQADARSREMAVRGSLGASRSILFRQLLTESVMLSMAGAAGGVALAFAGVSAIHALDPASVPRLGDLRLDLAALAFTAMIAVITGVLFGLTPALRLSGTAKRSGGLADHLKDGGRTSGGVRRRKFRHALVASEIALSVILVVGAGLMIRSLLALQRIDLGFNTGDVLTLRVALPSRDYGEPERVVQFYRELQRRVEALPGVESAGFVRLLPLTGTIGDWSIQIEGRPAAPGENPHGDWQVVTPGYFETMGMTLMSGRFLEPGDDEDGMAAVVINETMAREYWPEGDALGKRFSQGGDGELFTIVGIVKDVRHNAVVEAARTEMYHPHAQYPRAVGFAPQAMTLVVKARTSPLGLVSAIRGEVRSLDERLPVSDVRTLEAVAGSAFSQPRFTTFLLTLFAAVALALASIGIYGVISYSVAQRTQEFGIRAALGAGKTSIVRLVLGGGAALALTGVLIGTAAALFLTRLMRALVYGVGTLDPLTFVLVPLLLSIVVLIACYVPARRAANLDPVIALRKE